MIVKRIQRKRTKGWKMPPNSLYVGRPTLFGNPFKAEEWGQVGAVEAFRTYIEYHPAGKAMALFLETQMAKKKKHLVCWCPLNRSCHADVLLEIIQDSQAVAAAIRKGVKP